MSFTSKDGNINIVAGTNLTHKAREAVIQVLSKCV